MTARTRILTAIAAVTAIGAVIGRVAGYLHLSQTFAAAAIGVVIGMAVALGALSFTPKEQSAIGVRQRKLG